MMPPTLVSASCLLIGFLSLIDGKQNKNETSRVIGGYTANIGDYPYMVSIQKYGKYWYHHCGGSIVTTNVILTACHCLVSSYVPRAVLRSPTEFRIVAGVTDLRDENQGQRIAALRIEVHPQCGGGMLFSDAGVIVLQRHLHFNNVVKRLNFLSTNRNHGKSLMWKMEKNRQRCMSPGWGTVTGRGYNPSSVLKTTTAYLMSSQQCASTFCRSFKQNCATDFYNYHQVCASSRQGIVCNGDSGGPLVCDGQVVGVVSWKWECTVGYPHVYTDIAPILDVAAKYL